MPKPFPPEFRRDVIAVALQGEQSRAMVARIFRIWKSCLNRWMMIADRDGGLTPDDPGDPAGGAVDSDAELKELRKKNRLLEQENEIPRRATAYFARDVLPKFCTRWSSTSPPTASPSR